VALKRGPKGRSPRPEWPRARGGILWEGLRASSPHQLVDLGERCKLSQRGPGRSSLRSWFWCILGLQKSQILMILRSCWAWQFLARLRSDRRRGPSQSRLYVGLSPPSHSSLEPVVCDQPPGPTQLPTLCVMGNDYRPKGGVALQLGSKSRYGSFYLWINVWVAVKTVWSIINTCHFWAL